MAKIHERSKQSEKVQIRLERSQQGSQPTTVAASEQSKLGRTLPAQPDQELPNLDDRLSQSVSGEDEIGGEAELAVEMPARAARVMKRQMHKGCVPAK